MLCVCLSDQLWYGVSVDLTNYYYMVCIDLKKK